MSRKINPQAAILCVDDEPIILVALKQELRALFGDRYIYETANNAADALDAIEELQQDEIRVILVISDWLMPGQKGDEFLIEAKSMSPRAGAILITGQANEEAIAELKQTLEDVVIIRKPWSREALRAAVVSCLDAEGPANGPTDAQP